MRVFLVALVLSSVACGGQNPAAPITPPATLPLAANLVFLANPTFLPCADIPAAPASVWRDYLLGLPNGTPPSSTPYPFTTSPPCQHQLWAFTGQARNIGQGCAKTIKGVTVFTSPAGSELARIAWTLDPSVAVEPNGTFTYPACCLTYEAGRAGGSYVTTFDWQPCGG